MYLNGKNILAFLALIFLCSCDKEQAQYTPDFSKQEVSLNAAHSSERSRTSLEGLSILWSEGDSVSVVASCTRYGGVRLDYDHSVKAKNINGKTAEFMAYLMGDHDPLYMIYPACETFEYDYYAKTLTTFTQNEFFAVKGNFPQGSNLALGTVADGRFVMHNLMSVLKFEITGSDIVEVVVESLGGESMSGTVTIDAETLQISSIDGWNHVKLLPETAEGRFAPGVYYLPIPAGLYSKGFVMDLKDDAGFHARKGKRESVQIPAGKLIELGSQDDWNVEIHIGACLSGELSFLGDNRFTLTGNSISGKDYELENTTYGVELSTDEGMTWESETLGVLESEVFDLAFEKPSPGKMLVRPWAQYKDDDKTYGDIIAYRPERNFIFTLDFTDDADVRSKFVYSGDDASIKALWEGSSEIKLARNTNKSEYGGTGYVDSYDILLMKDLWTEGLLGFPTEVKNTAWYTLETLGLYFGNKSTTFMIPAVPGCKLDRVFLAFTQSKRQAIVSESKDVVSYVGNYSSYKASAAGTGAFADVFVSEWKELSTNAGTSAKVTKMNTPYYIYMNGNGRITYMEFEYIPVE